MTGELVNVIRMSGDVKETREPTRRFHLPSAVRASPARIDSDKAGELLARGAVLVDVRRLDDLAVTLEHAVRISPDEIPVRLDEFPRNTPIVLACG